MLNLFLIGIGGIIFIAVLQVISNSQKAKEREEQNANKIAGLENFTLSKEVKGVDNIYTFAVDVVHQKIAYIKGDYTKILQFSDIMSVDIVEDSITIWQKSSMQTVGRAIVGGVIGGGTGAIIGGLSGNTKQGKKVSKVQVIIKIRDINNPTLTIDCFDSNAMGMGKEVDSNDIIYKQGLNHAQRIADLLTIILDAQNNGSMDTLETEALKQLENDYVPDNVKEAVANGNLVQAAKLYIESTGCSVEEAVRVIDSINKNS